MIRELQITIYAKVEVDPGHPIDDDVLAEQLDQVAANAMTHVQEPIVGWDLSGNELEPWWGTSDVRADVYLDGQPLNG